MINTVSAPMPSWLKRQIPAAGRGQDVQRHLATGHLHTVCQEARCPNRAECFGRGTATFLILGNTCTRSCSFCAIGHGAPQPLDPDEPQRIAAAVHEMGLSYAVITSVTRDDLPDGGAQQFARTITAIRSRSTGVKIEVLIPDFQGSAAPLAAVMISGPDVLNHNIETVPRLYAAIRPQGVYARSLELLERAKALDPSVQIKSGIMVGLGETPQEVETVLKDLHRHGCTMVTIGQYLRPSKEQVSVEEYISPEQFESYREYALTLGFVHAFSGPFVRSSYHAGESFARSRA